MKFVNEGHLGGYVAADNQYPNGDPMTYTPFVWEYLLNKFNPTTVLDVGCGEGHALLWFLEARRADRALKNVGGYEGCKTAIENGRVPGHVVEYDFTDPPLLPGFVFFDQGKTLVWSCEFVEHVEEKFSENFLKIFAQADVVAMTHAFPNQPGHHHVNCQPMEYWVDKMKARGFSLDHIATAETRALALNSHWKRSGLVFVKNT